MPRQRSCRHCGFPSGGHVHHWGIDLPLMHRLTQMGPCRSYMVLLCSSVRKKLCGSGLRGICCSSGMCALVLMANDEQACLSGRNSACNSDVLRVSADGLMR